MAKYHLKDNGEPGKCEAQPGQCPKKNSDGSPQEHFDTYESAQTAYENSMKDSVKTLSKNTGSMKLSELNSLAKDTNDSEIIDEAIARGSKRTFNNIIKNPNVNAKQLSKLRNTSNYSLFYDKIIRHENYPVKEFSSKEFATIAHESVRSNDIAATKRLFSSNDIDDDKVDMFIEQSPTSVYHVRAAVENPNNKLSHDKLIELGEKDPLMFDSALASKRIQHHEIANMDRKAIYWANVDREKDPNNLEGYAQWVENNSNSDKDHATYIGERIASNPNANEHSLDILAETGIAPKKVWEHRNSSDRTRKLLEQKYPEVRRAENLKYLDEITGGIRKEITIEHEDNHPFGRNRGYQETTIKIDKKKVHEFALTRDDVLQLIESRNYMSASYNESTGVFKGMIDSSD